MLYKGFELKRHVIEIHGGIKHTGIGIFRNGKYLSLACDMPIAKRTVDAHLNTIWKE